MEVFSFDQAKAILRETSLERYLTSYLSGIGCTTAVLEDKYVDRGYLIDYSKYYARTFHAPPRFTRRLHFFQQEFSGEDFANAIRDGRQAATKMFRESYLGFVIVKPTQNSQDKFLVGRAVLKPYPPQHKAEFRHFITTPNSASLYGIKLIVDSLPFQTQDRSVGACASTALWVAMHPLRQVTPFPFLSLAEITEQSSMLYPGEHRRFPSEGLNLWQMIRFMNSFNLDIEIVKPASAEKPARFMEDFVKAYVRSGLPIIATIRLHLPGEMPTGHAVIISGYRADATGRVKELYVHDDQIGPYSRTRPKENFLEWQNEWTEHEYEVRVEKLIVPVYEKIHLPFSRIYEIYLTAQDTSLVQDYDLDLFLTMLNPYKQSILEQQTVHNKLELLTSHLPRFLWIIRAHHNGRPITDFLFDGTDDTPRLLRQVDFDLDSQ